MKQVAGSGVPAGHVAVPTELMVQPNGSGIPPQVITPFPAGKQVDPVPEQLSCPVNGSWTQPVPWGELTAPAGAGTITSVAGEAVPP